nr:acetyl-CoA C-acyltransferase [Dehalococcoidales bacterium]
SDLGMAPARQAAVRAGVPVSVPAVTVNKVCGSGLKAVMLAAQAIKAGDGSIYVAGGMESMSNGPYLLPRARTGYRLGNGEIVDATVHDGLWCSFEHHHMGNSAEHIAKLYGISRREQDEFALASHRKAVAAASSGRFAAEIVPVEVPQKKGSVVVSADETPRPDTSLEALSRLQPAFQPEGGTVTAGNAPGLSDGAAALVVVEGGRGRELGLPALARVTGYATAALEPLLLFAAPPLAIRKLLSQTGLGLNDFDLIEINEAFASQVLANGKELGWDWQKVNVHGGAVALGHPIGASGARILTTLIYTLRQRGGERGLAVACLGGGEAVALSVELA